MEMSKAVKFSALVVVLLLFIVTGCAHTPGGITDSSTPLEGKEYEIMGKATGEDNYFCLLGLIPLTNSNTIPEALANAVSSRGGDAMINVTVESYAQWWFVVTRVVTIVQGDVIKFK